jgi:hypothetical protein
VSQAVRPLNATAAGELTFEPPAIDLARLDWFPPDLAWRFQQAAVKAATHDFGPHLDWALRNGYGAGRTISKFDENERNELAVFAGRYRGECGTVLPHVAAGATIQRYGERGPSKHPPRAFPAALMRRGKRRRKRAIVGPGPSSASLY